MRYFMAFSYFGKEYHGWQRQPNAITIQQVMEDSLSTLLNQKIELVGAGRTDAGVHAREMFAHFDVTEIPSLEDLKHRLNAFLPADIALRFIREVPSQAHARFDALSRTYEYWLVNHKDPFLKDGAHYVSKALDVYAMNTAAAYLLEFTNFKCFSKSNSDVRTFNCRIDEAFWTQNGQQLIFNIKADRFLRNMVRAIVGTLLDIGRGRIAVEDVKTIIKSEDRSKAGASVPAKGLYLTKIEYPEKILNFHG